jgi:hypothetical protein
MFLERRISQCAAGKLPFTPLAFKSCLTSCRPIKMRSQLTIGRASTTERRSSEGTANGCGFVDGSKSLFV